MTEGELWGIWIFGSEFYGTQRYEISKTLNWVCRMDSLVHGSNVCSVSPYLGSGCLVERRYGNHY